MQMLCACVSCASCGDMQRCILYGLQFVSDIIGDQILLQHSSVVLVMAVYVLSSVSLDFPSM